MKKLISFFTISILLAISCSKENNKNDYSDQLSVTTGVASNILFSSAELSGEAIIPSTAATNVSFGVLYSTSSEKLIKSANKGEALSYDYGHTFTISINKLIPGTKYYYRCYLSIDGEITYGEEMSFTTLSLPEDAVDLGLSVAWHQCNIGASTPEEYGKYFAWGDVTGQTRKGSSWSGGGFSTNSNYEVDFYILKPDYDAAHVILGGNWRMPTKAECAELIDGCTCSWTTNYRGTGVAGKIFTSKKAGYTNKSIFFPAAGYGHVNSLYEAGSEGHYWSSTFYSDLFAWYLHFNSDICYTYNLYPSHGRSVRPVTK